MDNEYFDNVARIIKEMIDEANERGGEVEPTTNGINPYYDQIEDNGGIAIMFKNGVPEKIFTPCGYLEIASWPGCCIVGNHEETLAFAKDFLEKYKCSHFAHDEDSYGRKWDVYSIKKLPWQEGELPDVSMKHQKDYIEYEQAKKIYEDAMEASEYKPQKKEEVRPDIVKSAYPLVAQKVTYYLRQELLLHQINLRENGTQGTISLDEFIEHFIAETNRLEQMPEGPERDEGYSKLQKYKYKYASLLHGDKIILSEQNMDELMELVSESIETLGGLGGLTGSSTAVFFMRGRLYELRDKITKEPDSPDKFEKLKKIEKYMEYVYLNDRIGLEPRTKLLRYEQGGYYGGSGFSITQDPKTPYDRSRSLFSIEMDGTVTKDLEVSLVDEYSANKKLDVRNNSQGRSKPSNMQEALQRGDYATYKGLFDTLSPEEKINAIINVQSRYRTEKRARTPLAQRDADLRQEEQISSMIGDVVKEIDEPGQDIED